MDVIEQHVEKRKCNFEIHTDTEIERQHKWFY
jgi:hypothetical protein